MTAAALLNNVEHGGLRVITRHSAAFGDNINQALVFPTEFEQAQREYPILFRRDANGQMQSVVLLGFDKGENLFLDENGWHARYIPAVQERGPFMIGYQEKEEGGEKRREPMILVDVDHPRVSATEGEAVFLPQGGNAPYLERIAYVLRLITVGVEASAQMFAAFEEARLIQPVALDVQMPGGTSYKLPDFLTIDQARLNGLGGAELESLHRAGFLGSALWVASSLSNVNRLIDIKARKRATG